MYRYLPVKIALAIVAAMVGLSPANAATVRFEINATVAYRGPGLNVTAAPFQPGDPVKIVAYWDSAAADGNPDSSGRYALLSLSVDAGSYSASTSNPAAAVLVAVDGQASGFGNDTIRLLSPFPYPGPTLGGIDVLGYPLVGFEFYMHDYTRTALSGAFGPAPTAFDVSAFPERFGQLIFGNYYAGPIVSFSNFSGAATVVPAPQTLGLLATGLLAIFRFRRPITG